MWETLARVCDYTSEGSSLLVKTARQLFTSPPLLPPLFEACLFLSHLHLLKYSWSAKSFHRAWPAIFYSWFWMHVPGTCAGILSSYLMFRSSITHDTRSLRGDENQHIYCVVRHHCKVGEYLRAAVGTFPRHTLSLLLGQCALLNQI